MLLDHTDNYLTAVKLEFFQAKTEAESLRPYITYRLYFVAIFARRKNIDTLSDWWKENTGDKANHHEHITKDGTTTTTKYEITNLLEVYYKSAGYNNGGYPSYKQCYYSDCP